MENKLRKPTYDAHGLTTFHYAPFLYDPKFEQAYRKAIYPLDPATTDLRYVGYVISWAAAHVRPVIGNFVECGTYNAKAASFILYMEDLRSAGKRFLLFDTFTGTPSISLTEKEKMMNFAGQYSDVSLSEVKEKLKDYLDIIDFHVGVIPDTLRHVAPCPVSFLHLDLNLSAPTKHALEFFYPLVQPDGIIIFDDYGWEGYEDQRDVIDRFFFDKPETILALPTGQGLVIKKHPLSSLNRFLNYFNKFCFNLYKKRKY